MHLKNMIKEKSCGAVLVGAYEAIIPGLTENIDHFQEKKEELKGLIQGIYSSDQYIAATRRGIRPIGRIKRLARSSKENFASGK